MAHTEKLCGYCAYMNRDCIKNGKFKCSRDGEWRFANDDVAKSCRKFCEIFWKDLDSARSAVEESRKYRKAAGCFIATAIMEILGKDANCEEVATLRGVRNNVISVDPNYRNSLMKYDVLGPIIARELKNDPNSLEIARDLYLVYIKGTVDYIRAGEFDKAITLYGELTNNLIDKYIIRYEIGPVAREQYDQTAGGHDAFPVKPKL